ncbi:hypothetical protein ACSBR1_005581 [Camellia fascicularis]
MEWIFYVNTCSLPLSVSFMCICRAIEIYVAAIRSELGLHRRRELQRPRKRQSNTTNSSPLAEQLLCTSCSAKC